MKHGNGRKRSCALSLSVPSTRVYAMKLEGLMPTIEMLALSVPSTRVYAMKLVILVAPVGKAESFSTLDSGLRDETGAEVAEQDRLGAFQYPRLGSTR